MTSLLSLLAACADPSKPAAGAPSYADPDGATLVVGETGVIGFADHRLSLAFGTVSSPEDTFNYDPYNLIDPAMSYAVPPLLEFSETTGARWDGDAWALDLADGATARLRVDDAGPGLRLTLTRDGEEWAPYVRARIGIDGDEAFYGLGEWFDGAEHRGHVHPMQIEIQTALESSYNEAHVPVPLLVSSAGWGILVDSDWPGTFDVGAGDPDVVEIVYNQRDGFNLDLYAPGSPAETVARYHRRTGMPEVPPNWAFAPLQWHDDDITAEILVEDAAAIRALGIPTGCVWIDNPWQTSYNSMQPDPARFPDWTGLIADLEATGFRMLAWTTPYVEEGDPEYAGYADAGWFVDAPILFSQFGELVDLTHPDAMAAWQGRAEAAEAIGIHGWKLDYGEDVQLGIGASRLAYPFANGEDERTMHHRYAQFFHRAYQEPSGNESFLLGRGGGRGGHVYTDAIWPGDIDSDFRRFGDDGHVGGLPSAIRAGTGLAASGYPFFASDTGGYRHDRPTHEVMTRWTEYSALLPIMQYGGSGLNHNPWDFTVYGESAFTEATLEAFTRYAVLHIRLFPYFRALADRAGATGLPLLSAQGFAYPDEGLHPDDAFLVGSDIYVSPVEEEGATTKEVSFPPGGWIHWWSGARHEGTATVAAPVGTGPVFQREGSAIPLLRRDVVTLASSDGSVESWADEPGRLNARIVRGAGAAFALATGEALTADDAVVLTAGSLYTGWDVEVWAPDGVTGVAADGVELAQGTAGCASCWIPGDPWVRVIVDGAGSIALR